MSYNLFPEDQEFISDEEWKQFTDQIFKNVMSTPDKHLVAVFLRWRKELRQQCPECRAALNPEVIEKRIYTSCTVCGWNRPMNRREILDLPVEIRRQLLEQQANDPEIIEYYAGIDSLFPGK